MAAAPALFAAIGVAAACSGGGSSQSNQDMSGGAPATPETARPPAPPPGMMGTKTPSPDPNMPIMTSPTADGGSRASDGGSNGGPNGGDDDGGDDDGGSGPSGEDGGGMNPNPTQPADGGGAPALPPPTCTGGTLETGAHTSAASAFPVPNNKGLVCGQTSGSEFFSLTLSPNASSIGARWNGNISVFLTINGQTQRLSGSVPFIAGAVYTFEIRDNNPGTPTNFTFQFDQ
jgi:hypothetical protein